VIPRAHVTAWRARAPWSTDAQVEQDLVVSRAIVDIFSEPVIAREFLFRGGTAIHKLFLDPPGRYSEDIDLVQLREGPIGPLMSALRARLDPWLGTARWKQSEGRVALVYRFTSETLPATPLRLKVEINSREHLTVLPPLQKTFSVDNP